MAQSRPARWRPASRLAASPSEGRVSRARTTITTPADMTTNAPTSTATRPAAKLLSSPKSRAPQTNAVMMFSGVQVPAARARPIVCEARNAAKLPLSRPDSAGQRKPESAPAEREMPAADDQRGGREGQVFHRHVEDARALRDAWHDLGQRYPRAPRQHRHEGEQDAPPAPCAAPPGAPINARHRRGSASGRSRHEP